MTKPKHHQVCKPRYNQGWGTRGQTFRVSVSEPPFPLRHHRGGESAELQSWQSQLRHGKRNKIWICDLRSNRSKLFPVWQPKASAWKQSWKCPGSVSGYKKAMKPPPPGLPRARLLQAWHGLCPGSRSWVKLLQEVRKESKQPEAQTSQCPLWGEHNPDPATRAAGCQLWARAELPIPGKPWAVLESPGQRALSSACADILPQCSLSPDTTCFTLSHVALRSEALAHLMQNLLIFVNSKLLWKTFLFSKQCPLLLFFACISPQLPPNPVLVKQGWRYFGHVFTLLMYTCLVSFHFPSDYTLLHKCSHLAQHRSFFLSTPE